MPPKNPIRTCIATREEYPQEALLRFAISPEGLVVFDAKGNLPGRGIWLKPQKSLLEEAMKKNLFAKSAKEKLKIPENLAAQVEHQLEQKMLAILGRAWRAGLLTTGYEKVLASLQSAEAGALIHAADAAEDGTKKLNSAARNAEIPIYSIASREKLAEVLQKANPVHLTLKKGEICAVFQDLYLRWAGFCEKDSL
jgi:predicted RNA-binding protein YlxR (DUF448 family)